MIFLGAGASAPFGIPTSETLTAGMRTLLVREHEELLHDIDAFWRGIYKKDPNYENILTFLMGLTNLRNIPRDSVIRAFAKDYPKHRGNYDEIVDEMYSKIISYCTAPFVSGDGFLSPNKLEDIFQYTYDIFTLSPTRHQQEVVFTTNYDPSIEIWCQKRNIQLYDNTKPTRNPEIKEVLPISESTVANGNTLLVPRPDTNEVHALKIVRLHGSVWVYETKKKIKMNRPRDRLLFTDLYQHLNKKPRMIFPGQESVLASGEWDVLYQYFKKMLRKNCLVIGYSFQDPTINRAFIDNLSKGWLDKIGILSPHPDEVVKNLFWNSNIPHKRIVQIPTEFGKVESLEPIIRQWLNGVFQMRYSSARARERLEAFRENSRGYLD